MKRWLIEVLVVKLGPGLVTAGVLAVVTVLLGLGMLDPDALHDGLHDVLGLPLELRP